MRASKRPIEQLPEPLPAEPMAMLGTWLAQATREKISPNPNAMTLATVDASVSPPEPDARTVLCKDLDTENGIIVFYSNYHSAKGRQLDRVSCATAVFHWDAYDLQARIRGPVTRCPVVESDDYFNSRPLLSRLGAWASKQSQPVASREALLQQLEDIKARFDIKNPRDPAEDKVIPRPENWGGYRLWARNVELWIGQRGRLHERGKWWRELTPEADKMISGPWQSRRLQP
ncbi:MAG: pyridoxamine 5'-phosphate oxidase [Gammaproteobacteria bacterium]|nr:pyridoxamine 5'-phosphate oxidase [Gammaproteobacteria bacterium]